MISPIAMPEAVAKLNNSMKEIREIIPRKLEAVASLIDNDIYKRGKLELLQKYLERHKINEKGVAESDEFIKDFSEKIFFLESYRKKFEEDHKILEEFYKSCFSRFNFLKEFIDYKKKILREIEVEIAKKVDKVISIINDMLEVEVLVGEVKEFKNGYDVIDYLAGSYKMKKVLRGGNDFGAYVFLNDLKEIVDSLEAVSKIRLLEYPSIKLITEYIIKSRNVVENLLGNENAKVQTIKRSKKKSADAIRGYLRYERAYLKQLSDLVKYYMGRLTQVVAIPPFIPHIPKQIKSPEKSMSRNFSKVLLIALLLLFIGPCSFFKHKQIPINAASRNEIVNAVGNKMLAITVKKGDNLWKIIEKLFGTKNEKEIRKYIKKVVTVQQPAEFKNQLSIDNIAIVIKGGEPYVAYRPDNIPGDVLCPGNVLLIPFQLLGEFSFNPYSVTKIAKAEFGGRVAIY